MLPWTWKNVPSQSVHQRRTHQPRTPSYEWTPPVPEKIYPLRTAVSSITLSTVEREVPPLYHGTHTKGHSLSSRQGSMSLTTGDSMELDDIEIIIQGYSSSSASSSNTESSRESPPSYKSFIAVPSHRYARRHGRNSSSEWDLDSSTDEDPSWSSSEIEDFFDNIYLERGPSSRRPLQPKFPETPVEELPPVYGLSFPAVPATVAPIKIPGMEKASIRPSPKEHRNAIAQQKDAAPSPVYVDMGEHPVIIQRPPAPRRRYRPKAASKRTKPSLDERIEALRRELEFLTSNHPSQSFGQEARSTMLREAARKRKEALASSKMQEPPAQSDGTDGND